MSSASESDDPVSVSLHPAGPNDAATIRQLARSIWTRVYPDIISPEQIRFMLDWMYSQAVLRADMLERDVRYELIHIDGTARGFAAFGPGESDPVVETSLHKLYLDPDCHGRGWGSRALCSVEGRIREHRPETRVVRLRVNRRNARAIRAYERNGYRIETSVCSDIGGGFVMDDFVMAKTLEIDVKAPLRFQNR